MIPASSRSPQPSDWRRQWREAVTDAATLLRRLDLPVPDGLSDHGFPVRVPEAFLARMRRGDASDPLLRQVLPLAAEGLRVAGYSDDAVGDLAARGATGLLGKYAGRALLIATGSCAVHCRYCFRRAFPYADELAARDDWRDALAWLRDHPDIHEVLLSGGDPWSLATAKLRQLTDALATIPHLRRLRIHTRLPIVLPDRVDGELTDWLSALPWPVAVVLHANHPREIDAAVAAACARLARAGARLYNQTVLLAGVNDRAETLAELSERLYEVGVQPYYLHQLDRVHGAAHFEVDDARALHLHASLRTLLPGYLLPELVREVAGAASKLPLRDTA